MKRERERERERDKIIKYMHGMTDRQIDRQIARPKERVDEKQRCGEKEIERKR